MACWNFLDWLVEMVMSGTVAEDPVVDMTGDWVVSVFHAEVAVITSPVIVRSPQITNGLFVGQEGFSVV